MLCHNYISPMILSFYVSKNSTSGNTLRWSALDYPNHGYEMYEAYQHSPPMQTTILQDHLEFERVQRTFASHKNIELKVVFFIPS